MDNLINYCKSFFLKNILYCKVSELKFVFIKSQIFTNIFSSNCVQNIQGHIYLLFLTSRGQLLQNDILVFKI